MSTNLEATFLLLGMVLFYLVMAISRVIIRSRRSLPLRAIGGYSALPKLQGRSIESGQGLHISFGTSGVGGADTAATLAGLSVLEAIVEEAVASDSPPIITVSDPTTLVLAQDLLRRSYIRQYNAPGYDPRSVHFIAASPMAYTGAVMDLLASGQTSANVMVGAFGPEAAMIVEEGARRGVAQVVSTSNVMALPLLYPSPDHLLVGEEMFVSGAYMGVDPARLSSVLTQDILRWVIVVVIFFGALIAIVS